MKAAAVYLHNPFNTNTDREVKVLGRVRLVSTLDPKWKSKPYICTFNGTTILRADWKKTKVKDGDVVAFIALPRGRSGGSQILKMVLMVALMVAVMYFTGGTGVALLADVGIEGFAATMTVAAVGMAGAALINMMIPPPRPPSTQSLSDGAQGSPVYGLNAQGNQARLTAAIPVMYGRHMMYPDFAAQPYVEYMSNEQYLYQLFCIGQGEYSIEEVRIEDTPVSSFSGVETQLVGPGGTVTLFPTGMVTSAEVSGATALKDIALGPFVVNSANTNISKVLVDVACPAGLYYGNDAGTLDTRSATFDVHAMQVDNLGITMTGGVYTLLGTKTMSGATMTPQRASFSFSLATAGRYMVKLTRTNEVETSTRGQNGLEWVGLRGYIESTQTYGNVTMLAVKMKADGILQGQLNRKINIIATRKLNSWSAAGGYSATKSTTKSIAWAALDMCRNAEYGAGLSDARINLAQLEALNALHLTRNDYFSGIFDSQLGFWEGLTSVCRAGRMMPIMQGGVINFVRDTQQSIHTAMFSSRNISKGSFKIDYIIPTTDNTDSVEVEYFSEVNWKPATVLSTLYEGTSINPAKVKLFGVTEIGQAWREGMYIAAQNKYRRKTINLTTELEGHIPAFGDLVAITHDMPSWGQSGEIVAATVVGANTQFTLSEEITFEASGTHNILLRRLDGSASGPHVATRVGELATKIVLVPTASLAGFSAYVDTTKEKTHFMFGQGTTYRQMAKVVSVTPSANYSVSVTCVNEDNAVHLAETLISPPSGVLVGWTLPPVPTIPVIPADTLRLSSSGTYLAPEISMSWGPAAGAEKYKVEVSSNNSNFTEVGQPTGVTFQFSAGVGINYVRVTPINSFANGAAVSTSITLAGDIVVANSIPPAISSFATASGLYNVIIQWTNTSYTTNASYYEIYRAPTTGVGSTISPTSATLLVKVPYGTNSFIDSTVSTTTPVTSYNYWLRTVSKFGDAGAWSAMSSNSARKVGSGDTDGTVVSATPADATAPTAVTAVTATAGLHLVSLKWTLPSPDDPTLATVEIWRNTANSRATATKVTEVLGQFYVDVDVVIGTAYYYWLRAVDFTGNSGPFTPATDGGGYTATPTAAGSSDVAAGAITATQLAANTITANKIAAGTITATEIAASTITAGKLSVTNLAAIAADMGAITAGSLSINNLFTVSSVGAVTIKSAASGQRTEILSDVIRVYDTAGILRVKLGNLA